MKIGALLLLSGLLYSGHMGESIGHPVLLSFVLGGVGDVSKELLGAVRNRRDD